jgi:hypothetical protein
LSNGIGGKQALFGGHVVWMEWFSACLARDKFGQLLEDPMRHLVFSSGLIRQSARFFPPSQLFGEKENWKEILTLFKYFTFT